MTSKLPFGGERVRLDQICSKGRSSLRLKDLRGDGEYAVYGASGVAGTIATYQNDMPYVAVVKDGAGVGRASLCEPKTSVLGTMQALIPNERVDCSYLLHLVRSLRLGSGYSGSTIPHIYFKDYGKLAVPLPPISEQRNIAAQLDALEAAMQLCDNQASVLSKLVKSRFVEMFEPLDYSDNTLLLSDLANIASGITKGRRVQSGTPLTEVPYMAVSNVKDGYIDRTVIKTIGVTPAELDKYRLFPNDVLMTEGGDPDKLGRGALLADPPKDCIHQNHVFRVRIDSASEMLPQWFAMYLQSPYAKRYFLRCAKRTTGIATINKRQIGNLPVRLPPLSLQREFAVFAAQADKSRVVAQKQKKTLQTLYDSLAQEYFAI